LPGGAERSYIRKMKLNAYGRGKVISEDGLFQLTEVSFAGTPDELRRVARFLVETAAIKEKVGAKFGHRHLQDEKTLQPWNRECVDVIAT
jgi:hypothetical protein